MWVILKEYTVKLRGYKVIILHLLGGYRSTSYGAINQLLLRLQ